MRQRWDEVQIFESRDGGFRRGRRMGVVMWSGEGRLLRRTTAGCGLRNDYYSVCKMDGMVRERWSACCAVACAIVLRSVERR